MAGDARKEIKISEGIIIITGNDHEREMHGGNMSVGHGARQPRDRVTAAAELADVQIPAQFLNPK